MEVLRLPRLAPVIKTVVLEDIVQGDVYLLNVAKLGAGR